ncbi:hypothetical protein LSH36_781g00000, partial [Paralvinella palmiformis]
KPSPALDQTHFKSRLNSERFDQDISPPSKKQAEDSSIHLRHKRAVCSMPSFFDLKRQWIEYQVSEPLHSSYYMLPQYKQYIKQQLDKSTSPNEFIQYGDHQCPKSITELSSKQHVQDQSLCPWYNVMNYDPDRYPSNLIEARCKCTTCTGVDPGSGAGCQPIYYNLPVLRRSNNCLPNGQYIYNKGWQKITVGCTCSMASSV